MKTNKTFEEYRVESLDELANLPTDIKATIVAGLRNCWNAALASVVEEPVLTEADLIKAFQGWGCLRAEATDLAGVVLKAVRIPASKPDDRPHYGDSRLDLEPARFTLTPQQEGGLTREWLRLQLGHYLAGTSPANTLETIWNKIQSDKDSILVSGVAAEIMTQEEFAGLESVHDHITVWKRYRESLESVHADYATIEATALAHAETAEERFQEIETLRSELAEAKKGRYAIGEEVEFQYSTQGKWVSGTVVARDENMSQRYGECVRPLPVEAPTPTIEQMMEEWVKWATTPFPGGEPLTLAGAWRQVAIYQSQGDIESLWRRDCKGGVK